MDISEIISSLTPEDINKLKGVASAFMGEQKSENSSQKDNNMFSADMLSAISKLGNVASGDDDRTALIKALKPLLSEPRQQKADEAIKILRLMQLLPLLRESGLLGNLL